MLTLGEEEFPLPKPLEAFVGWQCGYVLLCSQMIFPAFMFFCTGYFFFNCNSLTIAQFCRNSFTRLQSMGTTQECHLLSTNPGSNTLQNSIYIVVYLLSCSSKEDMLATNGKASVDISDVLLLSDLLQMCLFNNPTSGHASISWLVKT